MSGLAAFIYDGRLPFLVCAIRVNWLTASISPLMSTTDLFITPFSSSNSLMLAIFFVSHSISSELDNIKGIGEKSKQLLLNKFKSVKRIREAGMEELAAVVGKAKAEIILNGLKP